MTLPLQVVEPSMLLYRPWTNRSAETGNVRNQNYCLPLSPAVESPKTKPYAVLFARVPAH